MNAEFEFETPEEQEDDTAGVAVLDRSEHLSKAEGALVRADDLVAGYLPA